MSFNVDLAPFASTIREIVRTSIEENFQQEGRFGTGVLGGGNTHWEKSHRAIEQNGKTLQDSGQLAGSIRIDISGGGQVVMTDGDETFDIHLNGNSFEITVGSNKPYAQIHQEGGKVKISITEKVRKYFWYMHYKTMKGATSTLRGMHKARGEKFTKAKQTAAQKEFAGDSFWKNMALTKKTEFSMTIPARPYLVVQDEDLQKIGGKFLEFLATRV